MIDKVIFLHKNNLKADINIEKEYTSIIDPAINNIEVSGDDYFSRKPRKATFSLKNDDWLEEYIHSGNTIRNGVSVFMIKCFWRNKQIFTGFVKHPIETDDVKNIIKISAYSPELLLAEIGNKKIKIGKDSEGEEFNLELCSARQLIDHILDMANYWAFADQAETFADWQVKSKEYSVKDENNILHFDGIEDTGNFKYYGLNRKTEYNFIPFLNCPNYQNILEFHDIAEGIISDVSNRMEDVTDNGDKTDDLNNYATTGFGKIAEKLYFYFYYWEDSASGTWSVHDSRGYGIAVIYEIIGNTYKFFDRKSIYKISHSGNHTSIEKSLSDYIAGKMDTVMNYNIVDNGLSYKINKYQHDFTNHWWFSNGYLNIPENVQIKGFFDFSYIFYNGEENTVTDYIKLLLMTNNLCLYSDNEGVIHVNNVENVQQGKIQDLKRSDICLLKRSRLLNSGMNFNLFNMIRYGENDTVNKDYLQTLVEDYYNTFFYTNVYQYTFLLMSDINSYSQGILQQNTIEGETQTYKTVAIKELDRHFELTVWGSKLETGLVVLSPSGENIVAHVDFAVAETIPIPTETIQLNQLPAVIDENADLIPADLIAVPTATITMNSFPAVINYVNL